MYRRDAKRSHCRTYISTEYQYTAVIKREVCNIDEIGLDWDLRREKGGREFSQANPPQLLPWWSSSSMAGLCQTDFAPSMYSISRAAENVVSEVMECQAVDNSEVVLKEE
jgi:hypothetical protein